MGFIWLAIGGLAGYYFSKDRIAKNLLNKLMLCIGLPVVFDIIISILLIFITGNTYVASSMAAFCFIASIAFSIVSLIKIKVHNTDKERGRTVEENY